MESEKYYLTSRVSRLGVLISVSFLHIIPKSFGMNDHAPWYLLGGYVALHFFNRFITVFVCDKNPEYAMGIIPMVGIGFHSLIDGVVYSITFSVSVFTGVLTGTGMVLPEFPEEIVTYVLLIRTGFSQKRSTILAFLAVALTTPLGTLISFPMISQIGRPALGALLSVSAGALVYVGATHLLPHGEHEPRKYSLVALLGGILVALGIILRKG